MICTDWKEKLHDHIDGTLPAADAHALDAHLALCADCRAELASLRALRAATANLPREIPPSRDLWPEIQREISAPKVERVAPNALRFPPLLWKLAAAVAVLLAVAAAWRWRAVDTSPAWQIASVTGTPRIDSKSIRGESRFHVGQWLETDATSRARVAVGAIGEIDVGSNSRVRLVDASANDHRVELERGTLSALIWAPPRLFFVDTPSATAVDLGCAYTLDVADSGAGLLRVTAGYVALEHDGRETVIARGQMCATRRGAGPGTPFAADAPEALRRALDRFDFENDATAVSEILAQARTDDSVTLWNLLTRVPASRRVAVFDTLARHHAPPVGVTRDGVVAGDFSMIDRWGTELGLRGFTTFAK